jgi:Ni,Fe-hydrogenase III component G
MNTEQNLQTAELLLAPWKKETAQPETNRLDVSIAANQLRQAVSALHNARWGYLSAITGTDLGPAAGQMEALYHFCNGAAIATLKIQLPRTNSAILPTIEDIIPAATFFEREIHEMLGFKFQAAKSNERLFIPDDWPEEVFPLRQDFSIEQASPIEGRTAAEVPEAGRVDENTFVVPIGPQHPALKEPGHFEFTVDGEIVTAARMRLGYAHRGIEKAAESRNWIQNLYLFERICGICSHTHSLAYSLGVEKLAQVEVSSRAQAIRELVAGLERIHSHLLWLGVAAHEAGFDTLFMFPGATVKQL